MGVELQLVLVGVLVAINAVFAGSEMALISLREGQLQRLEERGGRGAAVAELARDPNRFLATIQVGITLAGFLASATAAVTLAAPVEQVLAVLGAAARPVAIVLVTAGLTFVTLVLGELAPKRIAMQRAEQWALVVARPLAVVAAAARPAVWLLSHSTDLVVRLSGGDPDRSREEVTSQEIRDIVVTGGVFSRREARLITGALEATERTLRHVLRPRATVVALRDDLDVEEAIARLLESGHTRAPVLQERLDDADRVVALLALVGRRGTVAEHASRALALPESLPLVDALRVLQSERQTMALVVEEYGGVAGIVTVEDLVEELVGEIYDEYDRDVQAVQHNDDGSLTVVGHFPLHDLPDIGVTVPAEGRVTVAGLVQDRLGRLPHEGDGFVVADHHFAVDRVREHSVELVTIAPVEGDVARARGGDEGTGGVSVSGDDR